MSLIQIPIIQLNKSMGSNATSLFSDPGIAEPLLFTTNLLLFLQIKSLTTSFLYIKTIKTKLYCASLFLLATFISSNFPVFPLYEVYISQYIIIGLVHTCRSQLLTQKYSYNEQGYVAPSLLDSRYYMNYTVVITDWLTVTKYTFLKWQWLIFL